MLLGKKPEKVRIVVDTSVLVSALHFGGKPEKVLYIAGAGLVRLLLSPFILKETCHVLVSKLKWSTFQADQAKDVLAEIATVIIPKSKVTVLKENKADNEILACAQEANAQYLITGDKKHLLPLKHFSNTKILTSEAFLKKFQKSERSTG
jgi:putative PIN family toxin of toxin-antitoxin system